MSLPMNESEAGEVSKKDHESILQSSANEEYTESCKVKTQISQDNSAKRHYIMLATVTLAALILLYSIAIAPMDDDDENGNLGSLKHLSKFNERKSSLFLKSMEIAPQSDLARGESKI